MKPVSHSDQKSIWEKEHTHPFAFKQMDENQPSGRIISFNDFLRSHGLEHASGLELGCGKGRNALWLAEQGHTMSGFDFSSVAIQEALHRSSACNLKVNFSVQDAIEPWKYDSESFDFVIDCFASCDIESEEGRVFAIQEAKRVLKPGGYFFVCLLSPDDEYHSRSGIYEPVTGHISSFIHVKTGKFEKTFTEEEVDQLYKDFKVVEKQKIMKKPEYFGVSYECLNYYCVFQKID